MHSAVHALRWVLPPHPGYSIAVLGALAVVMALRKEIKPREKALWVAGAFLLMSLEIWAITQDRRTVDYQHGQDIAFFERHFQNMVDALRDIQTATAGVPRIDKYLADLKSEKSRKEIKPPSIAPVSLKVESLQLARDIYNFMAQRRAVEPHFAMPTYSGDRQKMRNDWDTEMERVTQLWQSFEAETVRSYLVNYSGRVTSLISKLKDKGLWNTQVCDFPESPVFYVRCASKIEAAANLLP